ncbi:MAG: YceI family protein [Cyclobacteriaceae bacterium]
MRLLLCIFLIQLVILSATQAQRSITVEANHSTVAFSVPIAGGVTKVLGRFNDFDLKMNLDTTAFTNSQVKFIIEVESIDTGIPDRDDHLRTPDFFDAEQFPQIIFESSQISQVGDSLYQISGDLFMHGVKSPVTLPFRLTEHTGKNIAAEIRTTLNRIDFGVGADYEHSSMENFIGKEIAVMINFWTKTDKRE